MAAKIKEWEPIDKPSPCWKYFVRNKADVKESKCTLCLKIFKNPNNDTCRYHVVNVHGLKVPKKAEQKASDPASAIPINDQPLIATSLKPKDSMDKVLARMTSVDRLSFLTIETSDDIQDGLRARGFKPPKKANTVKQHVNTFAMDIKRQTKAMFEDRRLREKFAITLDEYTSLNNKR